MISIMVKCCLLDLNAWDHLDISNDRCLLFSKRTFEKHWCIPCILAVGMRYGLLSLPLELLGHKFGQMKYLNKH